MVSLPLVTERLLLRPVTDGDLPALYAILADAEVMKLALYCRALDESEAQRFIDEDFTKSADDMTHLGVLCRKDDGTIIGFAGVLPCKYYPGDLEIGFVLRTEAHHRGYATEIGRRLVDLAFGLGQERLLGLVEPRNAESIGALTRIGMSRLDRIETADRGAREVYEIRRD